MRADGRAEFRILALLAIFCSRIYQTTHLAYRSKS